MANLPYNVAVPVVLHLLATQPSLRKGLVMVQAEVADRMTAGPGSRVYGVPSVKLAWYAAARRAGPVLRTVFWPVPNVDSGLVAFTRGDQVGLVAITAAVSSAYPVIPLVGGLLLFRERLMRWQAGGAVLILAGLVLLGLGS